MCSISTILGTNSLNSADLLFSNKQAKLFLFNGVEYNTTKLKLISTLVGVFNDLNEEF